MYLLVEVFFTMHKLVHRNPVLVIKLSSVWVKVEKGERKGWSGRKKGRKEEAGGGSVNLAQHYSFACQWRISRERMEQGGGGGGGGGGKKVRRNARPRGSKGTAAKPNTWPRRGGGWRKGRESSSSFATGVGSVSVAGRGQPRSLVALLLLLLFLLLLLLLLFMQVGGGRKHASRSSPAERRRRRRSNERRRRRPTPLRPMLPLSLPPSPSLSLPFLPFVV